MSDAHFANLAKQGYNRAPVMRTVLSDYDTPLSVYHKLAKAPYSYLFESVQGGDKWGRYSIIGLPCQRRLLIRGNQIEEWNGSELVQKQVADDPLAWIEAYQNQFKVYDQPGLPAFSGGLVGYFGYDTIRYVEKRLQKTAPQRDDIGAPDIELLVSEELVVFDNLSGQVHVIVHADLSKPNGYSQAQVRLDELQGLLSQPMPLPEDKPSDRTVEEEDFVSSFGEEAFKDAVAKIKEYIFAGDAMQVVISQQMSLPYEEAPIDLYRALRYLNPSPYMFFMDMGDLQVVGSSPEILVRLEDNQVTVRPIAGTRRRGLTPEKDRALEEDLLNDPKEIAEHLMLIDLGRNDVGRIAQVGSVELTEKMVVERYSHVMHIVSNVNGIAKPGMSAMDVLRATFPAGTVSGAPKIRAMEIIDEFEPVKRGIYSGAVGYLGWHGNMDTAIAIRTAVIKDKRLFVQAGAGIVADSVPQSEWDETMNKGRAVFRAAEFVAEGLQTKNPDAGHR
ncbi:anthranilate synthase component I [Thiomicrorhabdus sp. ZW0627]|uniref:anthranilate synthase component I n=1 Tax=Thiomicrorhabdus sp. ZW0627 TaxID=3039774 RepID=UPI002436D72E|nr:anthranilate synthase component I [Thiomicrorhabdus sp. ZW0627]MDG6774420.1 anthranilate synthase component I [Thiomicrorhabdus sp. ZW0627]